MEITLLRRLVPELEAELRGRRLGQAYAIPRYHLALVVGTRKAPRLWFAAEPDEPHLYLRDGSHPTSPHPPAFAMAMRKWARGRRIETLRLVRQDRIVELRWSGQGARLVFELVPRRATALLLNPDGRVVATWNPRRGRPQPGDLYEPPRRPRRRSVSELTEEDWRGIMACGGDRALARELLRTVENASTLVVQEAVAAWRGGIHLPEAIEQALERAQHADTEPCLYEEQDHGHSGHTLGRLRLTPYPLAHSTTAPRERFGSALEAVARYYPLRAERRLIERTRTALEAGLRTRRVRLLRAREQILDAAPAAADPTRLRRQADLLLACPKAEIQDGAALVPDPYAAGEMIEVRIDPSLDQVANAQSLYRRARRLERKLRFDAVRVRQIDASLRALERLQQQAESLHDPADGPGLLRQGRDLGLAVREEQLREPEAHTSEGAAERGAHQKQPDLGGEPPAPIAGIARYRTSDGHEILVGRNARANDRLTHEIAARDDWWLHAVGPGSHVVLRNPRRLSEPPPTALHAAAALAAWFSKARRSTKVEVRWTRVRQVRRPRKSLPGMAVLKRYSSLLIEPRAPKDLLGGRQGPASG